MLTKEITKLSNRLINIHSIEYFIKEIFKLQVHIAKTQIQFSVSSKCKRQFIEIQRVYHSFANFCKLRFAHTFDLPFAFAEYTVTGQKPPGQKPTDKSPPDKSPPNILKKGQKPTKSKMF